MTSSTLEDIAARIRPAMSAAEALLHSFPTSLGLAPRAVRLAKRGVTRVNYAFLASEIDENDPSLHCAARLAYPRSADGPSVIG
ncbi:hypothetical protein NYP18_15090 [Corynebacterium sp. YIM 101645]|uniref:Uncharacterized protein n=1 Tax=Corynebacterium lemuris TaxID=1859292 RepID=A0ABT2G0D4_9CORY|nr:hypothetical protein [Corynebacterium lemuris]MCS5480966.1 hypothetical protein [Corynebacterium lemuris]